MQTMKKALKWAFYLLLCLVGLLVLVGGGGAFLIEIGWYLVFGWIHFIMKNLASAELNRVLLAEGIACTVALGIGTHYLCHSLYREANASAARAWRWQWTASGLALVLLLFVACIGTIGVTHQMAWLLTSSDPLLESRMIARARISEAVLIGSGVKSIVAEFYDGKGRLPQSAEEAGYAPDPTLAKTLVSAIAIREHGVIVVMLNKDRDWPDGGEITLTPTEDTATKRLTWKCRSTLPPKLLPASCRE
jgi:hypothetical protein